ncbi:hypothetical protein [Mastigocoleus testarum]|uniref:Uncharacterized protein n=1 Tax=Mastigocoleus testarum BC008 TaxID=371196 RepID=A0A0V7ZIC2_9CYAN|nr:hypothetical protein [Mastigocoleus testarum]KST64329.1 hypothetical protein BC008_16995 [Mastigocoleus testarum BC008]KST64382.1 hypothetical protein BC008_17280 [Mastigocoleus testarum BC008]
MSLYIYDPRIHLFAFSAKENVNNRKIINKNWIWDKCNEIISRTTLSQKFDIFHQINIDADTTNLIKIFQDEDIFHPIFFDENAEIIPEQPNKDKDLILLHTNNSSVYAIQIDENYGLCINFNLNHPRIATQTVEVNQLRFLNPENVLILGNEANDSNQFVGQTLLITAQLLEQDEHKTNKELRIIAKQCIKALFPDKHYPFNRQGQLFNSPIFEYGSLRRKSLERYQHILVWLFYNRQEREKFYKNYNDFLDLFLYRARITSAFKEIRRQENLIAKDLKEINDQIDSLHSHKNNINPTEEELFYFKNKLTKLPKMAREYGRKIGCMYEFESSSVVKDNSKLYHDKLTELEKNTENFSDKDINFLKTFIDKNCKDFLENTAAKLKYFVYSSTLTDSAIASVRGQIAIEQTELEIQRQKREAKSQYKQQITILAIGSGIAAGEIFASSYDLIDEEKLPLITSYYIHPFFLSIFYSLLFGSFVAILIWTTPHIWKFVNQKWELTKIKTISRFKVIKRLLLNTKNRRNNYPR